MARWSRLRGEHRRLLCTNQGASTREAILIVAGTATRAVVFSGVAFVLAMLGMFLMPDSTLSSLAVGAIGERVDRLRVRSADWSARG